MYIERFHHMFNQIIKPNYLTYIYSRSIVSRDHILTDPSNEQVMMIDEVSGCNIKPVTALE